MNKKIVVGIVVAVLVVISAIGISKYREVSSLAEKPNMVDYEMRVRANADDPASVM